ncbi:glutamate-5-semialdehyde dehydrogenase [Marinisporobacter balticus]|uniref:Gamma-glutamyl phosphate reductase n=1 Tax=Marinisporobacter balticus TaxID=2018667 RepID=A0A4R2L3S2_9FIRM|nr:glutamate-5-semialdehyde dehydrogenase [Marinisporobacter balticus]TCO79877.1 glutamate-5-semialdehyde dehydrogenase [Marinisporobacter balticus]
MSLIDIGKRLYEASQVLATMDTKSKNEALKEVALSLKGHAEHILRENQKDIEKAIENNMKESLIDRLRLSEERIDDMIEGIHNIIKMKDPVWKSSEVWTLENGLTVSKMTVPIGVIGIIYESRPNVTVDAFSLTLKSGNCILLRGSSSSMHSNRALVYAMKEGLKKSNISEEVIGFVDDPNRSVVKEMLTLNKYIDLIIPRGGNDLIQFVVNNASVPTIETGVGNCHIFVDATANIQKAINIIENAKVQRPGVCNACETVLVHKNIAEVFLPKLYDYLKDRVEMRGCEETKKMIPVKCATKEDWAEEYLDYILAIKIVQNLEDTILHIRKYGTKHSEAILTENLSNANKFLRQVDAAAVYVNASTRFTDGSQFGFGAEMGISTQKMHARGPMGLNELVTIKYTILGNGQIRE